VISSYLRSLWLLAHIGVQHILCCVFVLFVFVLCTLCCHFLWIVHMWLPLRYSLTFISVVLRHNIWIVCFLRSSKVHHLIIFIPLDQNTIVVTCSIRITVDTLFYILLQLSVILYNLRSFGHFIYLFHYPYEKNIRTWYKIICINRARNKVNFNVTQSKTHIPNKNQN
jgi:hypothetical protein